MFDEHFLRFFLPNAGGKWVSESEARPNGDASAIYIYIYIYIYIFFFFFAARGRGKGESEGGGDRSFIESPTGGGVRGGGSKGWEGVCGELRSFLGRNVHQVM